MQSGPEAHLVCGCWTASQAYNAHARTFCAGRVDRWHPVDGAEDADDGRLGLGHVREGHLGIGNSDGSQHDGKEDLHQKGQSG